MKYQPTLNEGRPHTASVAPSRYAYVRYRCRCDDCRQAAREFQRASTADRARRLASGEVDVTHGRLSTYVNWACRCAPCTEAHNLKLARWKAGRP
jgi:hypothetical protein